MEQHPVNRDIQHVLKNCDVCKLAASDNSHQIVIVQSSVHMEIYVVFKHGVKPEGIPFVTKMVDGI